MGQKRTVRSMMRDAETLPSNGARRAKRLLQQDGMVKSNENADGRENTEKTYSTESRQGDRKHTQMKTYPDSDSATRQAYSTGSEMMQDHPNKRSSFLP